MSRGSLQTDGTGEDGADGESQVHGSCSRPVVPDTSSTEVATIETIVIDRREVVESFDMFVLNL